VYLYLDRLRKPRGNERHLTRVAAPVSP
jgi:hypothetical protein